MHNIVIVGEAWGEHEERERAPFVGPTGYELTRMLTEVGIRRADCFLTNVFNRRPRANKIDDFCGPMKEGIKGYPTMGKAGYIRQEFIPELERLGDEILEANPNIIICLGNTALWALAGITAITKFRGTTRLSTHTAVGYKLLPTYHPAALFKDRWEWRPIIVADLSKALRESTFPEIRRPKREIWIEPDLEDIRDFTSQHINGCRILSVDIETSGSQITCIGFSPRKELGLVIPFNDRRRKGGCYWASLEIERECWKLIRGLLEDRSIPKVFQNGLYDIAFLFRAYGIRVANAEHDTMLLHHALQPESLKGLGFLGSIYTDESSWKQMRERHTTIKRDD